MHRAFFIVFITTNKRTINITAVSFYVIYTPTYLEISVSSFLHLCVAKLHKFLKLKLLKSQFHKNF